VELGALVRLSLEESFPAVLVDFVVDVSTPAYSAVLCHRPAWLTDRAAFHGVADGVGRYGRDGLRARGSAPPARRLRR